MPYTEIAQECGYPTAHAANQAVLRLIAKERHDDVVEYRAIEQDRIEALMRSLWLAAINPGMALKAARESGQPQPPDQARAVELLTRLIHELADAQGTRERKVVLSGPDGGPIPGRLDVVHWVPDDAFLVRYAQVLKEAGLWDEEDEPEVKLVGPSDPD